MQLRFRSDESSSVSLAAVAADGCAEAHELMVHLFIDQVGARLSGIPEDLRADICQELRQHLEALIAAHLELGYDAATATAAAIRQFGEPQAIAARFLRALKSTDRRETTSAVTQAALKFFCLGIVVYSLSLLSGMPYGLNLHGSVDAALRSGWLWGGMWLVPSIGGASLGWKFPKYASRGAFYALSLLTAVSAPLFASAIAFGNQPGSTLYSPSWYIWAYSTFLFPALMTWLPTGSLSALVVGRLRSHRGSLTSNA